MAKHKYKQGDVLSLRLVRRPIYEHHGYAPAERETTKKVVVRTLIAEGGYVVRDVRKKGRTYRLSRDVEELWSGPPRPVKYIVMSDRLVGHKELARNGRRRRVRRNGKEKITLYANPYDISARGWYFNDADDFDKKFEKHLPVEEYEIEWIDGPEEDRELFEALEISQATLHEFFDLVDELWEWEKAALFFLVEVQGEQPRSKADLEELVEKVRDEVRVREGTAKEYVYDMIDDMGGVEAAFGKRQAEQYFDYERFGRDIRGDLEEGDPREDLDDEELGEEYVDSVGFEGLGELAEQYFDVEDFARDMELNRDVQEFKFAGTTYTSDYRG